MQVPYLYSLQPINFFFKNLYQCLPRMPIKIFPSSLKNVNVSLSKNAPDAAATYRANRDTSLQSESKKIKNEKVSFYFKHLFAYFLI